MKRSVRIAAFTAVLAAAAALLIAETLVIKVQTTSLRREPKFYAASVATLRQERHWSGFPPREPGSRPGTPPE